MRSLRHSSWRVTRPHGSYRATSLAIAIRAFSDDLIGAHGNKGHRISSCRAHHCKWATHSSSQGHGASRRASSSYQQLPEPLSESAVAGVALDLQTSAKIEGEESQIATITLRPGQTLRAESGSMIFMTEGVQMETSSDVSIGMKRFMTGQNVFVTDFTYTGDSTGTVALGTDFPSKLLKLHLPDYPDSALVCQKGAYLASSPSINIEMAFTKSFTSGFFGGEGFVLQKLEGDGDVLIKAGGTLVTKELEEGESLRVTSGSLVAFTSTVDYGTYEYTIREPNPFFS